MRGTWVLLPASLLALATATVVVRPGGSATPSPAATLTRTATPSESASPFGPRSLEGTYGLMFRANPDELVDCGVPVQPRPASNPPPGITARFAKARITNDGWPWVASLTLTADRRSGSGVHFEGWSTTSITADGRNITDLGGVEVTNPEPFFRRTVLPGKPYTQDIGLGLYPCLDPETQEPVAGPFAVRLWFTWRDSHGVLRRWRLEHQFDLAPSPNRTLPMLTAEGCTYEARYHIASYVPYISNFKSLVERGDIFLMQKAGNVEAHAGVAVVTMLLINLSGKALPISHDGTRVGPPDHAGTRYVLAPGDVVALPLAFPMRSCASGESVRPGFYPVGGGYISGDPGVQDDPPARTVVVVR